MIKASVLIPCYNAQRYLGAAIRSALEQLPADHLEVLVWDDGSTDLSRSVAEQFGDRITILGDGVNRGGNFARQHLTEAAQGDWLQFLDADDVLLPRKIRDQLSCQLAADIVYSPPICLDSTDTRWDAIDRGVGPAELQFEDRTKGVELQCDDPWVRFIRWGDFQTSSMLFRRDSVIEAGGWKLDQSCCQEHELILRMMIGGARIVRAPNQATLYRVHQGLSVSRKNIAATMRTRMMLTERVAQHLAANGLTSPKHERSFFTVWLEAARKMINEDTVEATRLFAKAGRWGLLRAASSDALPLSYRLCAAVWGFRRAEELAARRRGA